MSYFVVGFLLIESHYNTVLFSCFRVMQDHLGQTDLVGDHSAGDEAGLVFVHYVGGRGGQAEC